MPREIEQWLAGAAIQIVETVQKTTLNAPIGVRQAMKPGEVDRAIVERVLLIYGVHTSNMVHAA